jgi:flagellar basal body-associated protein FliL
VQGCLFEMVEKQNEQQFQSAIASANRETTRFCRYKKTYYLAVIMLALFLVLAILAVVSLCRHRSPSTAKPAKPIAVQSVPVTTTVGSTPTQTSNFLQDLIAQI